jgi:outer membrane protein OmpA-like peptidoglycan-associated protein
MRLLCLTTSLLLLGSCTSPPKPPTADAANRRPVNAAASVGLQVCQTELQNLRISAAETRVAEQRATRTALQLAAAQSSVLAHAQRCPEAQNLVYTVLFRFGDSRLRLDDQESRQLLDMARLSPFIFLRGRTDGTAETAAESRIARQRAEAVRDWLVRGGIEAARIRTTWQAVGDHAAGNESDDGRRLNRRAEIELYRTMPRPESLNAKPDA